MTAFVDLRGGVYLMAGFFAFFVVLLLFLVLLSFRHISDTLEEESLADLVALWIHHRLFFMKPD